ncbi:MAG: tetratricopeptide repeat protein [Gammaproteobacteria bacterium]|nr:tetratricopeptide repeat protein [Gammaproteobacteria bacterium]
MNRYLLLVISLASLILASCAKEEPSGAPAALPFDLVNTPVGDVSFPVGCNADAAPLVERGVALLHHMMYDEASFVFGMADDRDPDCALAYWGSAMTLIHPLWTDVLSPSQFERGTELVEKSLLLGGHSDREDAYLETTRAYFEAGESASERERLQLFKDAWKTLSEEYPEDLEARAFYSLALRATANSADKEFVTQKAAGLIAEGVLAENPNHPGAHHYIIHAYDIPGLAEKALATADNYGKITPRVPHATHMMTHIYTRLGQWEKAIEWNTQSADTAWAMCLENGEVNSHYTHAMDYLAYAYLQTGNDSAALGIMRDAEELQPPYSETSRGATAYSFSALPARLALERRDWEAAAKLRPRVPTTFPWEKAHDPFVAITHFARALAASHLGRPDDATADIEALRSLRAGVGNPYWAQQVEIQEIAARAWQAYARGDTEQALETMRRAAALEASTEKHAITPGEVLPAAELLGDLLFEAGRFEEALEAYRSALQRAPGRYNGLYGAGQSARAAGDDSVAVEYFTELLLIADNAENHRRDIDDVRSFVNGK